MAKWSSKYGSNVNFICVSVEGLDVARYFNNFTGNCINSIIVEEPQFPVQLGCSGFVVVDQNGNIVTTKSTPSFLDADELAFRGVEKLLSEIMNITSVKQNDSNLKSHNEIVDNENHTMQTNWKPLPHVGHIEMDDEHKLIDDSLCRLISNPSRSMMIELRNVVAKHFQHEEEFLSKIKFGTSGLISAHKSHTSDHQRILSILDDILEDKMKLDDDKSNVNKLDVSKIVHIIHQHGERFDSLYAKKVEDELTSQCKSGLCTK